MSDSVPPIAVCDLTEVPDLQVLPTGQTLEFKIARVKNWNEKYKLLTYYCEPTVESIRANCPELKPDFPVSSAEWTINFPNRGTFDDPNYEEDHEIWDNDQQYARKQHRLKRIYEKFGIPLNTPDFDPAWLIDQVIEAVTREDSRQKPEDIEQYGKRIMISDPKSVVG